jgi:hypothetical protein
MSVHLSSRAWRVTGLTPTQKLVLLRLADMANDEGVCWPSYARIGAECEIEVRSVRRIVQRLELLELVKREERFNKAGLQTSNWLVISLPEEAQPTRTGGSAPRTGQSSPPGPASPPHPDRRVLPTRTGGSSEPLTEPPLNRQALPGFERWSKTNRDTLRGGVLSVRWASVNLVPGTEEHHHARQALFSYERSQLGAASDSGAQQ